MYNDIVLILFHAFVFAYFPIPLNRSFFIFTILLLRAHDGYAPQQFVGK